MAVQSVDDTARYHIDIETDDLAAEVARLTGLGATPVSQWLDCHVLRAPGGHLLCVIPGLEVGGQGVQRMLGLT